MSDFRPMGTRVSSHSARRQPTIALDSSAAVGMTVGSARPPSCHFEPSARPLLSFRAAAKRPLLSFRAQRSAVEKSRTYAGESLSSHGNTSVFPFGTPSAYDCPRFLRCGRNDRQSSARPLRHSCGGRNPSPPTRRLDPRLREGDGTRRAPSCHFERSEAQSRNPGPTPVSDFRPMGTRVPSQSARRQPTIALDSSAAVGMTGKERPPPPPFLRRQESIP